MENASKALIIAASILIGIVLLSMFVFIFNRFNDTARATDNRLSQREIDSFNAKFVGYETGDDFSVTYVKGNLRTDTETTSKITYSQLFNGESLKEKNYYNKSLVVASQNLNKVSDVISAINDAIDINYKNNNSYEYGGLEVQSSVEIIIDLGNKKFSFNKIKGTSSYYKYLLIEPNKNVKAKNVYGFNSIEDTKEERVKNFEVDEDNTIKVYDMLEELRDTKIIEENNKQYTVYKYYFSGDIVFNEITNLIETVKFTLIEDGNFLK